MNIQNSSPAAIAEKIGNRLKQARLNADMSQVEVAQQAGVSRRTVLNAEKGQVRLESLVAIMGVLGLTGQLEHFLPVQEISPIQLARLKGRKRQRASGKRSLSEPESSEW